LSRDDPRLRADCDRCFALCCVAPAFSASADFAIDKAAGQPCPNLGPDFRCGIHHRLRQRGFPGCTVYDCFGAGQRVAQRTFAGRDWRGAPHLAGQMFAVFGVMRRLHELLWYLGEALELAAARPLHDRIGAARDEIERLACGTPDALLELDPDALRRGVDPLLLEASALARASGRQAGRDLRGADLIGKDLRGADLRGANLRGAYLIGADLTGADLRGADVIGADFRAATLRGADLTGAIFVIQAQLDAATGDHTTNLPIPFRRPAHWPA
jgi:uncharacterized protein YjbI with pentapeptide repeats